MSLMVSISKIVAEPDLQSRVDVDRAVIADYKAWLDEHPKEDLPPVQAVLCEGKYLLWDGFQRLQAYVDAGRKTVPVQHSQGTFRDALRMSLGANPDHGLRRTNADKRNAVEKALTDAEWSTWPVRDVAKLCNVSHTFVHLVKGEFVNVYKNGEKPRQSPPGNVSTNGESPTEHANGRKQPKNRTPAANGDGEEASKAETNGKHDAEPAPEAKAEEPAKDAVGHVVPEKCLPAFAAAQEIAKACRQMDAIGNQVKELAGGPGGRLMHTDSQLQSLRAVRKSLWGSRATHVCPYCKGKRSDCNACKGDGWVNASIFDAAPNEKKAAMIASPF